MPPLAIVDRRIILRDFTEADRLAFVAYQQDGRYRSLYDFDDDAARPNALFDLFLGWQGDCPRTNRQLGIFDRATDRLLGCAGLRNVDDDVAILGIELAPDEWGRFRVAVDTVTTLLRFGFETLQLTKIIGDTASGNRRVARLARWFGAQIVARRQGPAWMQARGWTEVDWAITSEGWKAARSARPRRGA